MHEAPSITSGHGAARALRDLPGPVLVVTMELPWRLLQEQMTWSPNHVHMVADMNLETLEAFARSAPPCNVVVGLGGGSSIDTAKYLAWKRRRRLVLAPTVVSADAAFTNTVAVRVDNTVRYVGDVRPEAVLIDYVLIQKAPKVLNRAGAADIASIHTALYDWKLAHDRKGELYDPEIAGIAKECLEELDQSGEEIFHVTSKGIDTLVELLWREVACCARLGSSRPEEGSEHMVAYHLEHLTGRHFIHGDLVALGIFAMSRLQNNAHEYVVDLMRRIGLRYECPDASPDEIRMALRGLAKFKSHAGLFFTIVDVQAITETFVDEVLAALGR